MTRILLVRHGQTDWNAAGRFQGQTDVPLNAVGERQAKALAQRLEAESIHAIYASDLRRAMETAGLIAAVHPGLEVRPDPRLGELHFGEWEGLTYAEIEGRCPQALAEWKTHPLGAAPPGGESLAQLAARLQAVLAALARLHAQETVLLAAHGGPLQVLICLALGLSPRPYWQFRLSPASLSEISLYPEGAVLNRLNDTCHLDGLP